MDLSFDDKAFSGRVPLFPLPGLVLLPGGLLPLHVFEQRYRDMMADALAGERLIALALLKPGYESDYEGAPAIEPHVCVGRIALEQQLEDGRWNLVLVGVRRARVLEEDQTRSYRLARVELLGDVDPPDPDQESLVRALRTGLTSARAELIRDPKRLTGAIDLLDSVPGLIPLGMAVDLLCDALELSLPDRLALLETPQVGARAAALAGLVGQPIGPEPPPPEKPWPPEFSLN